MSGDEVRDYLAWHAEYDDPGSALWWRLRVLSGLGRADRCRGDPWMARSRI